MLSGTQLRWRNVCNTQLDKNLNKKLIYVLILANENEQYTVRQGSNDFDFIIRQLFMLLDND